MMTRMPGEFEPHAGTFLIWPSRPGSWPYEAKAARKAFKQIISEISKHETVYVLAGKDALADAKAQLKGIAEILPIETDDAWARDMLPTFVLDEAGRVHGIDWEFNAWGGDYDGLYAHWEQDDAAAKAVCERLGYPRIDAHPFVLEGGSIHTDGEGTMMVTESCLLSPGRNPNLSKTEIEDVLKKHLGIHKALWLPCGIFNDETNEHIDNVAAFVRPGEILLAWTDDKADPQYAMSKKNLDYLEAETDAKGRRLKITKLPIPKHPICVTEDDLGGYTFEDGEDTREAGERLAASYANFYICNGAVLLPQFGDEHDGLAVEILKNAFPERNIVPIPARDILLGGGNIHCITQQLPKGGKTNA